MNLQARIQSDFSSAAAYYHTHATLQKDVTHNALALYAPYLAHTKAPRILDIGCGTGFFSEHIHALHLDWDILQGDYAYGMCQHAAQQQRPTFCTDMTRLALKNACLDGFFSCLSLQWIASPAQAFVEAHRTLKHHQPACFVTFGTQTLTELANSFAACGHQAPVLAFSSRETLAQQLQETGFRIASEKQEVITEHYASPIALMRHLKNIGADFKHQSKGLMGKQSFHAITEHYTQHFAVADRIRASFEIYYFIVIKE